MANNMSLIFGTDVALDDCRPRPVCEPRPVCPACGGLECLCRPRFFAGQLLTEEDLNRLDHYIVAKNRLHNRHLFGTGVVCGLEVVCATCTPAGNSTVVVRPGYALSPCGNDIVICREEAVDICELINRCRPRRDDCFQPGRDDHDDQPHDDHDDDTDEWVLAICYKEKPSRGVTPLRGASCSCGKSSCGCGGGGHASSHAHGGAELAEASCGCGGGGGSKPAKTKPAAKSGPRPPQCEPTLTCESYTFAVYKVPRKDDDKPRPDPGSLIKRFICCLLPLFEQVPKLPTNNASQAQLRDWLRDVIAAGREFLITEGLYDCEVAARLNAVVVPAPGGSQQQFMAAWIAAAILVLQIFVAVLQKCLCAALLPPCPPAEMNDCVPLATVTVARARCRVKHICNISNRRFLTTWPALKYWFSWLPLVSSWLAGDVTIRKLVERICCRSIADMFNWTGGDYKLLRDEQAIQPPAGGPAAPIAGPPVFAPVPPDQKVHPFTQLLGEAIFSDKEANPATVLLAALGATKQDGGEMVSELSLKYPGQAMLIHQVLAPALEAVIPFGIVRPKPFEPAGLQQAIEALERKVSEQQAAIDELRNR
jgi:hypothetical protein